MLILMIIFGLVGNDEVAGVKKGKLSNADKWASFFRKG
jgi:hypothetical protein